MADDALKVIRARQPRLMNYDHHAFRISQQTYRLTVSSVINTSHLILADSGLIVRDVYWNPVRTELDSGLTRRGAVGLLDG